MKPQVVLPLAQNQKPTKPPQLRAHADDASIIMTLLLEEQLHLPQLQSGYHQISSAWNILPTTTYHNQKRPYRTYQILVYACRYHFPISRLGIILRHGDCLTASVVWSCDPNSRGHSSQPPSPCQRRKRVGSWDRPAMSFSVSKSKPAKWCKSTICEGEGSCETDLYYSGRQKNYDN